MELIQKFASALASHGLEIDAHEIRADGKLHRFTPAGDDRGSNTAWYVLHVDFPQSGAFGSWRTGLKETWTAELDRAMTWEERDSLRRRMEADKKRKLREEEQIRAEAAKKAEAILSASQPCPDSHPYLTRKKIRPSGARLHEGLVTVPIISGDEIVGLQFIPEDGKEKRFLSGTPIKGAYFLIGCSFRDHVIICEGFATGATLAEATGLPVIVAFFAGNLEPVAKAIRKAYPRLKITIAADDDRWTANNPGIQAASKAAAAVKAGIRRPIFAPGFEGKPTDFNDLAVLHGLDEVEYQILNGRPSFEKKQIESTEAGLQVGFPDSIFFDPLPNQIPMKTPLATIANLQEIMRRIGARVRYNVIRKKEETMIEGRSYSLDNQENAVLADVLDACSRFQMATDKVAGFLTKLADLDQFNPVLAWIESQPWDGVNRLDDFFGTVTAVGENPEDPDCPKRFLKQTLMRRWMISAVAAAYRPKGVSAHGVLVFQGPQYLGKTQWFRSLVPEAMELIMDGAILKPDDKDSVYQIIQNWIVELGELDATFRKADIAQLKAFITKDRDTLRLPYAQRPSTFPRRTVFFASVNASDFLNDSTGNRRFWTIECAKINHRHAFDMQQVWAEAAEHFKSGESWFLEPEEMELLNDHNEVFSARDPIEERIAAYFDWSKTLGGQWMTATEILQATGIERPTKAELSAASAIVRKLNKNQTRRTKVSRELWVPERLAFRVIREG